MANNYIAIAQKLLLLPLYSSDKLVGVLPSDKLIEALLSDEGVVVTFCNF
jgi:hypothetical protein